MQRLKILIRKPGQNTVYTAMGGRLSSVVVTFLALMMVIAIVATAIVFGYLIISLVLTALLLAIAVAMIRYAFRRLRL